MTKGLANLGALLVVFFGISIGSVVHSVNVASEGQAKVSGTNELIAADGVAIAVTAVAVEDAPLYIIPVLPDDAIKRLDSIRSRCPSVLTPAATPALRLSLGCRRGSASTA